MRKSFSPEFMAKVALAAFQGRDDNGRIVIKV